MENKLFKTGDKAPVSGQYEIVGPRGGERKGLEITMIKGNRFPPVENNCRYKLVDTTKHKKNTNNLLHRN